MLSLLIALFSVAGTLVALLSQTAFFLDSSTSVTLSTFPPADREAPQLWIGATAYNSGNRPSLVSGARIVTPYRGPDEDTETDREALLVLEPTRVEPDDPILLELRIEGGWDIERLFGLDRDRAEAYRGLLERPHRLEIGVQEFGEELAWKEVAGVPAERLREWLESVTTDRTLLVAQDPQGTAPGSNGGGG